MPPRALWLAIVLLTAGCLGDDAAPSAATPADDPAAIGTASTSTMANESIGANGTIDPDDLILVPVSFDGRLVHRAAVCDFSTLGDCFGTPGDPNGVYEPEVEGAPVSVQVELTWSASSPITEELGMWFGVCTPQEDDSMMCEGLVNVEGSSPLTVDVSDLDLPDGAMMHIGVYESCPPADSPAPGVFVFCEVEQSFHLEGVVELRAP